MNSEFDKIVAELQEDVWADFSETVREHAQNPRNLGRIENPDGYAALTGQCGDAMQIWLKVEKGVITGITFWTDGCGTTIASGSMVTEMAKGKKVSEAFEITALEVLERLGGLPEDSTHCAFLAVNTLHEALKASMKK